MATVPVYEGRNVNTALPQVRESVNYKGIGGEAIAQGVENLGKGISSAVAAGTDIYQQQHDRSTNIALAGMQTKLERSITGELDGSNDDKGQFTPGYMSTKGTEAYAREQSTLERLQKARDDIAASEEISPQAKERFMAGSDGMLAGAQRRMVLHQAQQKEAAATANIVAAKATALDTLSRTGIFSDPVARAEAFSRPEAAIRAIAVSKEAADHDIAELRQRGHAVVIKRYLSTGDVDGARRYYDQTEQELGSESIELRNSLDRENLARQGRLQAAAIATESHYKTKDGKDSPWLDPVAAANKVAALPEGDHKEQARKHLDEEIKKSDANRKRAGDDMLDQLAAIKSQTGSLNTPEARDIVAWLKQPENGAVLPLQRYQKWVQSEARADRADAEGRRAQTYANKVALAKMETLDDDELKNFDPRRDPGFADADLLTVTTALARQRTRLESADKGDAKTAAGIGQSTAEVRANAKAIAGSNERLKTDPDLSALYTQSMTEFADDFEVKNKRRPNAEEVQKASDQALMEHTVKRTGLFSIFGNKTELGLKTDGPPRATVIPKKTRVPKAERIQQLKSTGVSKADGLRMLREEGYQ